MGTTLLPELNLTLPVSISSDQYHAARLLVACPKIYSKHSHTKKSKQISILCLHKALGLHMPYMTFYVFKA